MVDVHLLAGFFGRSWGRRPSAALRLERKYIFMGISEGDFVYRQH